MIEVYKLIIICPLIFISGFIDAIAGGGSIISVPTYLIAGLSAHYAYGTHKFVTFWGMLISAIRYIKNKHYELKLVIIFSILCMLGTYIGSKLILYINEIYLQYILIFLITFFLIFSCIKKFLKTKKTDKIQKNEINIIEKLLNEKNLIFTLIIGLILGIYSGTIGIGNISIFILIFLKIFKIDHVKASGSANIVVCLLNLVAMITFLINKKVIFVFAIPATISSMLGHYIGAGLAMKKANKIIEPLLKVIFVILFIELIVQTTWTIK